MPEPTRAQIRYGSERQEILRFNSVISEDHTMSSELSKYPAQTGEVISNNAITKNRVVTLKGIVTNTPLDDPYGEFVNYGTNNQVMVFDIIKGLIRNKEPCEVLTNLGIYEPVIFNRFSTKQVAGMTDAIEFTISGEEVQIASAIGGGVPTPLSFSLVGFADSLARLEELNNAGYDVSEDSILSEAEVDLGKDFSYITTDALGNKQKVTHTVIGVDAATGVINYDVSVTNIPSATRAVVVDVVDPSGSQFLAGVSVAAACLAQQAVQAATAIVDEYVDTALGKLKKVTNGFLYGILGVNGNSSFGQLMLGIALDCFVAGAVGATTGELTADDFPVDLPTKEGILQGATNIGNNVANDTLSLAAPTTLTKISPAGGGGKKFFGDIL